MGDHAGRAYAVDIAKKLADPDRDIRTSAILYFAKLDEELERHCDSISDRLTDEDAGVRQAVVSLFGNSSACIDPLLMAASRHLDNSDPRFVAASALAIGATGS